MSIGAVLEQLRPDFPDVTVSKIRFLESEGLVRPARTSSGYRQFTAADLERLRFVLLAQRDHYLPLKVIKERLEAADRRGHALPPISPAPLRAVGTPSGQDQPTLGAEDVAEVAGSPMTREDLMAATGATVKELAELEQFGLIQPDATDRYGQGDAEVVKTVRDMAKFGIEPRHLRAFRAAADREVGLLEQVVMPMYRRKDLDRYGSADEVVHELTALSVALHTLLVRAGLRRVTGR